MDKEIPQKDIDSFYDECDGALPDLLQSLGVEYIEGSEEEVRDFVRQRAHDKFYAEYGEQQVKAAAAAIMTEWCGNYVVKNRLYRGLDFLN